MKPIWSDVYSWYKNHEAWQKKCEIAEAALEFTNQVKTISKDKVQKLYGVSIIFQCIQVRKICVLSLFILYSVRTKGH